VTRALIVLHLSQLEPMWPEWELRFDEKAGAFVATLRVDWETRLIAQHVGALEGLLLDWARGPVRPPPPGADAR
jgi:hypothetical protein